MKRIKVLFTIPNFDTAGSGKALLNIAKGLDTDKFEAHIMCLHDKGPFFKVVESSGLPVHRYNYIPDARPVFRMFKECWQVSRYFKKINPDIIHSYNYSANYTEALAARMAGIPWVFTKKNMNWGGKSKNGWKLRSLLAKKIAVQNKDMMAVFYNNRSKAILIPRGVDVTYFQPTYPLGTEAILPGFPSSQRLLICVANFVPVKGIEILIQAFYKLNEKHINWSLLLVGDDSNDYGKQLQNEVSKLKMTYRIKFSGKLLDVRPQLNRAEIFILPTRGEGEGSPVALLEAMASEKVVLGSNVPGIRDQLENFPDYLFEPSNIEDLANKLDNFMLEPKEYLKEIGLSFSSHVTANYPIAKEIEKHELLYETIIIRR
ncbi:glycosyltransferase [Aequorivita lipolytica]|uniref:Glycosyltransferase n=1 Tax=Aequorivita lipolytica TaxID=153267 RepID=A0A5C6YPK5_9FLAO|nr:glycosyltransferase [Aequorivita lipolytica]TXD68802.1 glycosyltransferase [Aequorivita lipolytica]SRX52053.1 Putative glycosyltransferase EpsF [Aequorivita lipolytica]